MIFMSGNSGKSTTLVLILLSLGVLVLPFSHHHFGYACVCTRSSEASCGPFGARKIQSHHQRAHSVRGQARGNGAQPPSHRLDRAATEELWMYQYRTADLQLPAGGTLPSESAAEHRCGRRSAAGSTGAYGREHRPGETAKCKIARAQP